MPVSPPGLDPAAPGRGYKPGVTDPATLRVAFPDPGALLEGLRLAQESAAVEGCTADLEHGVLEVRGWPAGAPALAGLRGRLVRIGRALG